MNTNPAIAFDRVSFRYDDESHLILENLSVEIPRGVVSLLGQNGTGKSTFLLVASGRALPGAGDVYLDGQNTKHLDDTEKNRLCSLTFQNMEFETEEPLGELLEFVYANGFLEKKTDSFLKQVVRAFDLESNLKSKTRTLSKGQMQRTVMAFALLYGSQITAMDEPVFALEEKQKHASLAFLSDYAKSAGKTFLFSAHELDLIKKHSEYSLLFFKKEAPRLGRTEDLLRPEILEEAYQIPYALLHQKERLHRETLMNVPSPSEVLGSKSAPR